MSYVDAALAPQRKTGQIKLHGAAAFDAARSMGVEAIAYRCGISCEGIEVAEPVPIAE